MKVVKFIILIFSLFFFGKSFGQGKLQLYPLSDSKTYNIHDVIAHSDDFHDVSSNLLNLGLGNKNVWLKITNPKAADMESLLIDQSRLSHLNLYFVKDQKVVKTIALSGTQLVPCSKEIGNVKIFKINEFQGNTDLYLNLISKEIFLAPVMTNTKAENTALLMNRDVYFGLYTGAVLIMFVYNLFLFLSVRDKNYFLYICYMLFTWLTQISIMGYATKFFWHNSNWMHQHSVVIFSILGLIFGIYFTLNFLKVQQYIPKLAVYFKILLIVSIVVLVLSVSTGSSVFFPIMQLLTLLSCILAYISAIIIYFKKKYSPARYYLIAWSILIIGVILFLIKDYEIIPYNNFTIYMLQIATVVEISLLSFALADSINFVKKENESIQKQALATSLENQKLIQEQNIILEQKVKERTEELEEINHTLNHTLTNLKSTQSQLVDAEKMAALGQLTAGIAHEINNPINFVTSNIKPLQLDIDDLREIINKYEHLDPEGDITQQLKQINDFKKQIDLDFVNKEITSLLSGISEGAKRTAEIIRSLRNFSRVDETDMKPVDLNEGLASTLVLVRNNIPDNLTVIKEFGVIPKVECLPGKINQVFMNLVSNAIQAIKSKNEPDVEEFLTVKTWSIDDKVFISIKDSGTGMTEEVKNKIFEPFFTTKDIGEGTGLGLSIVFGIIEKHKGNIEVISQLGEGTEFIITLHTNLPN